MSQLRRIAATLCLVVGLAAPAPALAQSPGDEQYEDPFAGEEQQQSEPQATATPAPAAPAQQAPAAEPAPAQPAPATAPAQAAQLPRTGWDAAIPGGLGFLFVSAGVALRARVRRDA